MSQLTSSKRSLWPYRFPASESWINFYFRICERFSELRYDVPVFGVSLNLVVAAVALTVECGACTYFYPTVDVGPNFRVSVVDRGRSVKGLRLKISGTQAITDKAG